MTIPDDGSPGEAGARPMTTPDDVSPYDAIAEWYDAGFHTGSPVHALALPAIADLCGAVVGQRICDVACGQGILTRQLAASGAETIGVDLSDALLEIARRYERETPIGVEYRRDDARTLDTIPDAAFDGITCCLALMDIADLSACLRAMARILRPGGWFVFAITHPCFQVPEGRWTGQKGGVVRREVRGYFREVYWRSENRHGVRGQVGAYHRTLSTYLNSCFAAGLALERAAEPAALDETARRVPGYAEVPAVFAARCRKMAT